MLGADDGADGVGVKVEGEVGVGEGEGVVGVAEDAGVEDDVVDAEVGGGGEGADHGLWRGELRLWRRWVGDD